jgi:signal peptidase II
MPPEQDRIKARLLPLGVLLILVLDQWSKSWVRGHLSLGQSLPETGTLRLTHITNTGSVFGLFPDQTSVLVVATLVILLFVPLLLRYLLANHPTSITRLGTASLGLILGGAIGNLLDRLRFGHVTDFVDLRLWADFHWPAFNLADASIVVGTLIFVYSLYQTGLFAQASDDSEQPRG